MEAVAYIAAFVFGFCAVLALLNAPLRRWRWWLTTIVRYLLGLPTMLVYVYGVLLVTILGRKPGDEPKAVLELFWSHRESLALDGGNLVVTNSELLEEIMLNILMFVPLGALLPFLFPKSIGERGFVRGALAVAAIACLCSLAIELTQLYFKLGLFEFDDVLNNTLGALAGYALYSAIAFVLRPRRA